MQCAVLVRALELSSGLHTTGTRACAEAFDCVSHDSRMTKLVPAAQSLADLVQAGFWTLGKSYDIKIRLDSCHIYAFTLTTQIRKSCSMLTMPSLADLIQCTMGKRARVR